MEDIKKALDSNYDLLDFFHNQYSLSNHTSDQFFYKAKYSTNKLKLPHNYTYMIPDKYKWEIKIYKYFDTEFECIVDKNYNKIDWLRLSSNPTIVWNKNLLHKYFGKLWMNCVIEYSITFWSDDLVRFIIQKYDEESSKVFVLQKFAIITNIEWNLSMIVEFPTSYWIREIIQKNTITFSFEDLKIYEKKLTNNIFLYLQVSKNLLWTYNHILYFQNLLDFKILSKSSNVIWTNEIIIKFHQQFDFQELSKNFTIPIDFFILDKFEIKWNFRLLSSHPKVEWDVKLLERFSDKIDLNTVLIFNIEGVDAEFIDNYKHLIRWDKMGGNRHCAPTPISTYPHIEIKLPLLIKNSTKWDLGYVTNNWTEKTEPGEWYYFSSNHFITTEHLEIFADKLWWDEISANEYITLTPDTLIKFADRWYWNILLNRQDFSLEHFYVIHHYLNFDLLNSFKEKIFTLLAPEKDLIYSYIRDKKPYLNDDWIRLLRSSKKKYRKEERDYSTLAYNYEKDFLIKECTYAIDEIKMYKPLQLTNQLEYYRCTHGWLRNYLTIYEKISKLSESLEREVIQGYVREINNFFSFYKQIEAEFKMNYFMYFNNNEANDPYK